MDSKFGLAELERLTKEIKVKRGDVRTVKVVLAVTGVPNTVVPEAQSLIAGCNGRCKALESDVAKTMDDDARDEAKTKATINAIKATRQHNRETNAHKVLQATTQTSQENSERARLEKILKNFA